MIDLLNGLLSFIVLGADQTAAIIALRTSAYNAFRKVAHLRGVESVADETTPTTVRLRQGGGQLPDTRTSCSASPSGRSLLPQVCLGPVYLSRLVLGANPINGGSHLSVFVNHQMKEYFTPENVERLLRRCEEVGINCWQSGPVNFADWLRHREATGSDMQFISLATGDDRDSMTVEQLAQGGVLGIAHHGEVTDRLFKQGKIEQVRDFLKRVRDAGVQVGLSTHMPAVIEYVEEHDWDLDFYMACAYERHRTGEELEALLGDVPIPVREVYLKSDPPRMYRVIRQARRTCLVFKILAAGRLCDKPEQVEEAFKSAFGGIKPQDAVIVGMYPRYSDQPAENAELTRKYGGKTYIKDQSRRV